MEGRVISQRTMKLLQQCTQIFSSLSDSNRQNIIVQLYDHEKITVNEITKVIPLSRPAVSHHLKQLLNAGLVKVEKQGTERFYSVSLQKSIQSLKDLIVSLEQDNNNIKEQKIKQQEENLYEDHKLY